MKLYIRKIRRCGMELFAIQDDRNVTYGTFMSRAGAMTYVQRRWKR